MYGFCRNRGIGRKCQNQSSEVGKRLGDTANDLEDWKTRIKEVSIVKFGLLRLAHLSGVWLLQIAIANRLPFLKPATYVLSRENRWISSANSGWEPPPLKHSGAFQTPEHLHVIKPRPRFQQ